MNGFKTELVAKVNCGNTVCAVYRLSRDLFGIDDVCYDYTFLKKDGSPYTRIVDLYQNASEVAAKVISITKRIGHCCDYEGISMSRLDLINDEVAYDNLLSEMLSPRIVAGTLLIDLK